MLLIFKGILVHLLNSNVFLLAYTLGVISPKRTIKKVITIIWIINSKIEPSGKTNAIEVRYEPKIIIAMFIKLFVISIVAKSLLGLSRSFSATDAFFDFSDFNCSISLGANEKYATSAPETTAEQNKHIKIIKRTKINSKDIG